jgi:hypothetical protein
LKEEKNLKKGKKRKAVEQEVEEADVDKENAGDLISDNDEDVAADGFGGGVVEDNVEESEGDSDSDNSSSSESEDEEENVQQEDMDSEEDEEEKNEFEIEVCNI